MRLDDLCRYLGIGSKLGGMDGAHVYDAWLAGYLAGICRYCAGDVEMTRELYRRLS